MTNIEADLAQRLGRVAVLYGGQSSEREISLQSGRAVIDALQQAGVNVIPVDVTDSAIDDILAAKADRAFIALHGAGGEDGKVQALLEFLNLPYTGSGVAASALCMDKLRTKQLWNGVGLPTPAYFVLREDTDWRSSLTALGGKAVVKPVHEGSSIGIALCDSPETLAQAYFAAHTLDSVVIAERYIAGAEYTVAVLDGESLPPIRLETSNTFYDFNAKYESDDTRYHCPCGLETNKEAQLKQLALDAFDAVGAAGWGRVDVMANPQGEFFLLEVNTVPGMTSHSLVPMAARAAGLSFADLTLAILRQTLD